jgi:hypothetical protein
MPSVTALLTRGITPRVTGLLRRPVPGPYPARSRSRSRPDPTAELFAKVLEKYAGLDLVEEAVKLRSYLREHPGELCSDRRVLNWLQGAQKRAAEVGKEDRGNGRPGTGRRNGYDPKAY